MVSCELVYVKANVLCVQYEIRPRSALIPFPGVYGAMCSDQFLGRRSLCEGEVPVVEGMFVPKYTVCLKGINNQSIDGPSPRHHCKKNC